MDAEAIQSLLDAETWYSAKDALAVNLVDSVGGDAVTAPNPAPQSRFKNLPEDLVVDTTKVIDEPVGDVIPVESSTETQPQSTEELTAKLELLRLKCKLRKAL